MILMQCGWCDQLQFVETWQDECRHCGECEFIKIKGNTMKIVNLTPHTLNVVLGGPSNHTPLSYPASGQVARVSTERTPAKSIDISDDVALAEAGFYIPVSTVTFGGVTGLPEPQDGVIYVVSAMVQARVPHRTDVYAPGELVREPYTQKVYAADGSVQEIQTTRIIGCRGLTANTSVPFKRIVTLHIDSNHSLKDFGRELRSYTERGYEIIGVSEGFDYHNNLSWFTYHLMR